MIDDLIFFQLIKAGVEVVLVFERASCNGGFDFNAFEVCTVSTLAFLPGKFFFPLNC